MREEIPKFPLPLKELQVVEGELERVEIQGLKRLKENYVRSRIRLAAGQPINLRRRETALQLLQVDPLFTSVQAELKAGTTPGIPNEKLRCELAEGKQDEIVTFQ